MVKESVGVVANLNGVWGAGSFEAVAVGDEGRSSEKRMACGSLKHLEQRSL